MYSLRLNFMLALNSEMSFLRTCLWMTPFFRKISVMSMKRLTFVLNIKSSLWEICLSWLILIFQRWRKFPSKLKLVLLQLMARDKSELSLSSLKSRQTRKSWEKKLTLGSFQWMRFSSQAKWRKRENTKEHKLLQRFTTTISIGMLTTYLRNRNPRLRVTPRPSIKLTSCFISKSIVPESIVALSRRLTIWWARIFTRWTSAMSKCSATNINPINSEHIHTFII